MMYETPTVTEVGKAEEVIRGIASIGDDVDGWIFVSDFEFMNDQDTNRD